MNNKPKIWRYQSSRTLATRLRDDLNNSDFVLLYAYNRTGKTRTSMEFKEAGKRKNNGDADTLYFNAYTEDLFVWDNDLENDIERKLHLKSESRFFSGMQDLALEESIQRYLGRYTDFDFDIDYKTWTISFSKGASSDIKISRGEENIFIWCLFMALYERVIDGHETYRWVKYVYIDDPISSLDDNNAIAVASDLAGLLIKGKENHKVVISTHHALFFNVASNELKKQKCKKYFLKRPDQGEALFLQATDDTPFFHHVAMLSGLQQAAEAGNLFTYHFNILRSILEKTATFFGHKDFSMCLKGIEDEALYSRALNLLSHGKYAIYEPQEMVDDNKELFRKILAAFMDKYAFELPELVTTRTAPKGNQV